MSLMNSETETSYDRIPTIPDVPLPSPCIDPAAEGGSSELLTAQTVDLLPEALGLTVEAQRVLAVFA